MSDATTDWIAAVRSLVTALGYTVETVTSLRLMSTSRVWRVDTDRGPLVARVAFPRPGKTPRFAVDALIRRRLAMLDSRVAQSISHHDDRPELSSLVEGRAWAVDSFIEGEDGTRETVDAGIWAELGILLAKLHSIETEGVEGIAATRLQQAWPIDDSDLCDHPFAKVAPHLTERISALGPAIQKAASGTAVVLHGDPANYNLRIQGGRLAGLIDFNDTFLGPPAWDFAWIAAYAGWSAVPPVLSEYGSVREEDIQLLTIPTALHSASRAVLLDQPDRMERMIGIIETTLAEFG